MSLEQDIIMNIFIIIYLYWYVLLFTFVPALYFVFLKIIAFPLAPNKSHEFVIIAKPEKVEIKKVSHRLLPFFEYKNGIYWFGSPCNDINSLNKFHVFIEGVNQSYSTMERRPSKINDLLTNQSKERQIKKHQIIIPSKMKYHLVKHWILTINPENNLAQLMPAIHPETKRPVPQPFKISIYHTLGLTIQRELKVPDNELSSLTNESEVTQTEPNTQGTVFLQTVTNENVLQQIKHLQEYSYYSSSYAFRLLKKIRRIESSWIPWLTGGMDPKTTGILIILVALLAGGALIMYSLGKM